jgi:peptide chain release factor 1
MALAILGARLEAAADEEATAQRNAARRSQVGAGMRGDKVRTYREQDERITDHRDGRTFPLSRWLRGDWDPGTS